MKQTIKYSPAALFISWLAQIIVSVILIEKIIFKLVGNVNAVQLFDIINMGPEGRIFIGLVELLIVVLLLSGRFAASGSVIGIGVMLGAIIAHATVIGMSSSLLALFILVLCIIIFVIRRKEVPLIGEQF